MTTPDEMTVLRAAVELWDRNGRGVTSEDLAERLGVEADTAKRELLPLVVGYFADAMSGDDGIAVVREPTAEARRITGG